VATTVARSYTPDYYLWEAMKAAVYKDNPHTLLELTEVVADFITHILPTELSRVFTKKRRRVYACLQARGGHVKHLL
jgi:hypothetical protein